MFIAQTLRKIIITDVDSQELFCQACEIQIKLVSTELESLLTHHHSEDHLKSLSRQFVALTNKSQSSQQQQTKENKSESVKQINTSLFDINEAKRLSSSSKNLTSYINKCIEQIDGLFVNLEQATIDTYKKVIKRLILFALNQECNVLSVDLVISFLKADTRPNNVQVMKKLLQHFRMIFPKNVEKELKNKTKSLKQDFDFKTSYNKYFTDFLLALDRKKQYNIVLILILIVNGLEPSVICRTQLSEIQKKYQEWLIENEISYQSKSIPKLVQLIIDQDICKEDSILFDQNKKKQTLNSVIKQLGNEVSEEVENNEEFKIFLKNMSLANIQKAEKQNLLDEARIQIKKRCMSNFSFMNSPEKVSSFNDLSYSDSESSSIKENKIIDPQTKDLSNPQMNFNIPNEENFKNTQKQQEHQQKASRNARSSQKPPSDQLKTSQLCNEQRSSLINKKKKTTQNIKFKSTNFEQQLRVTKSIVKLKEQKSSKKIMKQGSSNYVPI